MGAILYEHNQTAYQSVQNMLREKERAAIIHPTGTGKSFIAFQLCEDHLDKAICWLSPSEYIFRTQLENWIAAGGRPLENIRFFTYARLMMMRSEELKGLNPDYIILDEFHRCGAEMWGQGVHRLLDVCQHVPVLGLSATSIRYLDGQRDMADELFEGNIASEMTLGEAIVHGILNPPKYVLSMYSWQKELERYQNRVKNAKNKAVRAEAEKYLEALRRALENADGLDEIFSKHMPEKSGKYLVFCANYDHMQEMIEKVPEWFHKVDEEPHIYSVYSEDVHSEQTFREFKADESDRLKLLFCIDMLNEGIHVDDVSGVILLRPTISPIIYKQQIGRALSAGKENNAVIFDVVMNIENLYSIGALEEEMQSIITYYHSHNMSEKIVNGHFRIIDEVKDCVQLFYRLNETLGASWEVMYRAAEAYFEEHGDLEAPKRYITKEGYSLGQWLDTQRKVRAGKTAGILAKEQIEKLDQLHMRWQGKSDASWEKYYAAAKAYYEEHGNLLIAGETKYGGVNLGKWIARLREEKKTLDGICAGRSAGIKTYTRLLTKERVDALEAIGMIWDVPDYRWEQNFNAAQQYYREYGNLNVPYYYTDKNGIRLGIWIYSMRSVRQKKDSKRAKLTERQINRLNRIGMIWDSKWDQNWERSYSEACRYRIEHGNLDIPAAYVTEDGLRLGRWIRHQREAYRKNLNEDRRKKLEALGIQ